jgi:hypothetical protein
MTQPSPTEQPSKDLHSAIRSIISSLLLTIKMFSLYAEDHGHCQKAVDRLHAELEAFLQKREALVLEVSNNQLLYLGEVVHQGPAKDGELAFALFRDGIMSLALTQGLEREETRILVRILERYKSLPTGAEGDIVTAFWEAELPHLEYQAVDNILDVDGPSDSSDGSQDWLKSMSPGGGGNLDSLETQASAETPPQPAAEGARQFALMEPTLLQLTADEARNLEEMVRLEEERDATQEILDMLADVLKEQQDEDFFSYVLDYMVEELRDAFGRKDFDVSLQILRTVNHIHKLCREAGPWAVARVRKFLLRISEPDFLDGLKEGWATVPSAQIAKAREVLLFLPPDSILQLGAMLREVPAAVRTILADVIVMLTAREMRPFEELIEASDENLLALLVPLMAKMEGERSAKLLLKMTHKPSEKIRKEALKAVILRRLWAPNALAPLLSDESAYIRQLFVRYLSSKKNQVAETLLIEHLKKTKFPKNNGDELIICFKALGKCGSSESIPFLQDTLLKGNLLSRFRDSLRRRGAAIALLGLNSEQSRGILEKASRSRFPAVRNAAQTVHRPQGE